MVFTRLIGKVVQKTPERKNGLFISYFMYTSLYYNTFTVLQYKVHKNECWPCTIHVFFESENIFCVEIDPVFSVPLGVVYTELSIFLRLNFRARTSTIEQRYAVLLKGAFFYQPQNLSPTSFWAHAMFQFLDLLTFYFVDNTEYTKFLQASRHTFPRHVFHNFLIAHLFVYKLLSVHREIYF